MTTIATLCTGYDGVGVGAKAAGLEIAWGVELEPAIAEVADANLGKHVTVANLLSCDPFRFEATDFLHASPPCTNASQANANDGETALDIALGRKVAEFVTMLKPSVFTLENVWQYRRFRSWHLIEEALHKLGYWVSIEYCNSADYAVPQTRKRMIVRAIRGGFVPYLPEPTPWVGWYAAVADLLDDMPDSAFAPWQLARLPALLSSVLVPQGGDEHYNLGVKEAHEPSMTITANHNQLGIKAFLMQVQGEGGDDIRMEDEPAPTITANHGAGKYRAFLLGDQERQIALDNEPAMTVRGYSGGGAMPRAWLVDGSNASPEGQLTIREESDPAMTITSGGVKHPMRSLLDNGRVVAMTPRALARFQSFPDSYILSGNNRLDAKGIGNGVPPLLYQRIIEGLIDT